MSGNLVFDSQNKTVIFMKRGFYIPLIAFAVLLLTVNFMLTFPIETDKGLFYLGGAKATPARMAELSNTFSLIAILFITSMIGILTLLIFRNGAKAFKTFIYPFITINLILLIWKITAYLIQ